MEGLKEEILAKRLLLDEMEKNLEKQIASVSDKENRYLAHCKKADAFIEANGEKVVKIDVSGVNFTTKVKTLMKIRDTFFYNLLLQDNYDLNQLIEFDRNPEFFLIILDYLRFRKLDLKILNKQTKADLRIEAKYFEIEEMSKQLGDFNSKLEIIDFEYSGKYSYKGVEAGTGRLEDLSDKSLKKGICAISPGFITFTLNDEFKLSELDIGGYCGNSTVWNSANGEGANIQVSLDKITWKTIASIPSGFGSEIKTVFLDKSLAKYVKFTSTSYLGIGYLNIRAESS